MDPEKLENVGSRDYSWDGFLYEKLRSR